MMNIIGRKKIFLTISGLLILVSLVAMFVFGFKQGIDFVGGTLWQIELQATKAELQEFLPEAIITEQAEAGAFLIRLQNISEDDHQSLLSQLESKHGEVDELSFESIGPAIGGELRGKAMTALVLVLVGISLYIAFVFRKVSKPVSSWKYGLITLVTLFHDAVIPTGLLAVLGYFSDVTLDTSFIVAILVVMGFSVHDTIVVFDRIREGLSLQRSPKFDFDVLVNDSVNQTITRSINTSFTLLLVLIALYFLGAASLQYFVLTIIVGTIAGTYSSIFVASPLLTFWKK
ncbi:MAG: protein translocase subunit SecF [bacterium]|nr:protein translocase subunit SecF [bacterium]